MKRAREALVMIEMLAVIAAMAIAGLCGAAAAQTASPVARFRGDVALTTYASDGSVRDPASFHVVVAFSTDPPEAELFTIQKAVVFFPDRAGTNGRLFPSCDARRIERFHGNLRRCPRGSKIGEGTVRARALQLGVTANARVTMFNSHRGRSITFNFRTLNPAAINESIDAPLTKLHGRYGEKLELVVPRTLQEIVAGVFVGIERFDVTIDASVRVRGVEHSYLRARACPEQPLHGVFDFKDWTTGQTASATVDTTVRCRAR
jgi:hypothetical protein